MPKAAGFRWKTALSSQGLGGIAAAAGKVVVSYRDVIDARDIWQCFDATGGKKLWDITYPCDGELDYGKTPRATPLIVPGKKQSLVYLQGAYGDLVCVDFNTGKEVWKTNLLVDYLGELPTWGVCGSPILIPGKKPKLVVQPGGKLASIVALDPAKGTLIWSCEGGPSGYTSPITVKAGGKTQIISYDKKTLGGWDAETGKRLWTHKPPNEGDFNVPTPILVKHKSGPRLILCTENNGTRLHDFDRTGKLNDKPLAQHEDLTPDSHTPVLIGNDLYAINGDLYCLDAGTLKEKWIGEDKGFAEYCSVIGSKDRLLVTTLGLELILVDVTKPKFTINSRLKLVNNRAESLSHPAIHGQTLFVRLGESIAALPLAKS